MSNDLSDLEARVTQLETMQELLFRLLSMTRPLATMLEQYGATRTEEEALLQFLDELVARLRGPESDRPSCAYFEKRVGELLPSLRSNREFLELLMDTLKVERPAYRELHEYMCAQRWNVKAPEQ